MKHGELEKVDPGNQKLVSIITPTYNTAITLRQCAESVRSQTYQHWEHIVVDDGSTDGSWELLNQLAREDPRLRIVHQANAGSGKARNKGLEMAKGDYIALLDADDISLPERLEMQVSFLNHHPDVDVLGSAVISISISGDYLWVDELASHHETLINDIYRRNPFYTSTVMARARYFQQTGGFEASLYRAQDYDLWLRGYKRFKYHNLSQPLVFYRRDTRPNWRSCYYAIKVILKSIRRERAPLYYTWFVLRHVIATMASKIGLR